MFDVRSSLNSGPLSRRRLRQLCADIVAKVFLGWRTKILRAADAFYARRREGTISFHPKSITDLRSGVEKRRSGREVQRSTFARFSASLDFRLLQQYLHFSDSARCLT